MKKYHQQEHSYYFQARTKDQHFPRSGSRKLLRGSSATRRLKRESKQQKFANLNYTNKQYFPDQDPVQQSSFGQSSQSNNQRNFQCSRRIRIGKSTKTDSQSNFSRGSTTNKFTRRSNLSKQLNKLNAKIHSKEKQLKSKTIRMADKLKDNQLAELYRIISFYQGKIKFMEDKLIRYEQTMKQIGKMCDQKSQHKTQIQKLVYLFEQMRTENGKLNGKIQEKDFQLGKLHQKLRKSELKISFLSRISRKNEQKALHKQQISNDDKKSQKSIKSFHSVALSYADKKKNYGNMQSKINNIQMCLNFLKKENAKLEQQLQEKQKKIEQLQESIFSLKLKQQSKQINIEANKQINTHADNSSTTRVDSVRDSQKYSRSNRVVRDQQNILRAKRKSQVQTNSRETSSEKYNKNDPLNKVVFLPKNMLKQIPHPKQMLSQMQELRNDSKVNQRQVKQVHTTLSPQQIFTLQPKQQQNFQNQINKFNQNSFQEIFRKLKMQLMTQQVSHQQVIQKLIEQDLEAEVLEEYPYNLSFQQAQDLIQYISRLKQKHKGQQSLKNEIKKVFPYYKDLTLKQQNNFKSQIYNLFCNRVQQIDEYIKRQKMQDKFKEQNQTETNYLVFKDYSKFFKNWNFSDIQIDVLCKAYYELTGKLDQFNIKKTKQMVTNWGK